MMTRLPVLSALSVLLALTAAAPAGLIVDQSGATYANGGYGTPVVQSFTPAIDNVAAIEIRVGGTAALTDDLTVSLYADRNLTQLLRQQAVPDVPRDSMARVEWQPVAVVPEQTYYLRFDLSQLVISALVSNTTDPYTRGNILTGGGNTGFAYEDAIFTTYAEENFAVPEPASLMLLAAGSLPLLRRQRG